MNKRGFIDDIDIDEEWLVAGGFGVLCAILMLVMFHFGGVHLGIGTKIIGAILGFVTGTIVSRIAFNF